MGEEGKDARRPTPDALVAGTARAHGAVLLTHNADDFPIDTPGLQAVKLTQD
jgi:predicted nucleic acid-binding protein